MDVEQLLFEANNGVRSYSKLDLQIERKHKNDIHEKEIDNDISAVLNEYKKIPIYCTKITIDSKSISSPTPHITINTNIWTLGKKERRLILLSQLIRYNLYHYAHQHPNLEATKVLLKGEIHKTRDKWESDDEYFTYVIITFNELNLLRKWLSQEDFLFVVNGYWRPYRLLDNQLQHVWFKVKKILKTQRMILSS